MPRSPSPVLPTVDELERDLPRLAHQVRELLRVADTFQATHDHAHLAGRVMRLARLAPWQVRAGGFAWADDAAAALWPDRPELTTPLPALLDLVHLDDRARVAAAMTVVAAHHLEFRLLLPDGRVRVVQQVAEVVDDPGGAILVGATQDVTERDAAGFAAIAAQALAALELDPAARREAELERRLHAALDRLDHPANDHGFVVHYQPRVDRGTGRVVGVEALLRWNPSDGPPVSPGEFIPIAERSSAITTIGMWVLGQACAQGAAWVAAGTPLRVSVNVSANQFNAAGFVERVVGVATAAGFDLELLELEITEHATVQDVAQAARTLHQLRACGVRVALDDFGVGQSSLSHLASLPVDIVKIDRSFVAGLGDDRRCDAIVAAVMALAERLDMTVVAEGVETERQIRLLGRYPDCEIQGFYCSRARPPAQLAPMLLQPFAWPEDEDDDAPPLDIIIDDERLVAVA